MEPRLQRRYEKLVVAHLRTAPILAGGLASLPGVAESFAATQAAWRFYGNKRLSLPRLAQPLLQNVRRELAEQGPGWLLVAHDWSLLHYSGQAHKEGRIALGNTHDLGYELLSSLALDDKDGHPLAPVAQELRAQEGLYSTRSARRLKALSQLDGLTPVFAHLETLKLGRPLVHILDREADSIGHYRQWHQQGWRFLVRADQERVVRHEGQRRTLAQVVAALRRGQVWIPADPLLHESELIQPWVAETSVTLQGPARQYRKVGGRMVQRNVPGPPLTLRLIVSELRDDQGCVRAHWLLLTNLPAEVLAATLVLWYYFRWRIESYFKLMKQAGQQLESWQQASAAASARRLLVASMAAVVVWHLARSTHPQAPELRSVLVRLSGRQMKRGPDAPGFTEPALLAGLGVLLPMLALLEHHSVAELRQLVEHVLPLPRPVDSG